MNNLFTWISIALFISVLINVGLVWYIGKILKKFLFISDNLSDLVKIIKNYKEHLRNIYSLDLYYGDETIKFLMEHTNGVMEILESYSDIYDISIPIEEETINEENKEETESISLEKDVLYAGTRRSDN